MLFQLLLRDLLTGLRSGPGHTFPHNFRPVAHRAARTCSFSQSSPGPVQGIVFLPRKQVKPMKAANV